MVVIPREGGKGEKVAVVQASVGTGMSREHVYFDKAPPGYSDIPAQPVENH